MPTPTNAPSAGAGQKQIQEPVLFNQLTERQEMPQTTAEIKGFSKTQRLTIEKVGVISRARLLVKLKFKTGASEGTGTIQIGQPQRLIKSLAIQANGVTGIIQASGMTLEQRRRRVYRNPVSAVNTSTPVGGTQLAASTEYTMEFVIEVPIAHDMASLIGSLLAQNEETQLALEITWCSEAEFIHGGKVEAVTGEIQWSSTTFSVGSTSMGNQEVTVLPDLSAFHGLLEEETGLLGTGERKANLIRTDGQLLCYTASVLSTSTAEISPAKWTTFYLEYGGNKKPLVWTPAAQLLEENADEYDGPLNINGVHFLAVDFEKDNPTRDMVIPAALTELRGVVGIASGETVESSVAQIITTQETLYPAV